MLFEPDRTSTVSLVAKRGTGPEAPWSLSGFVVAMVGNIGRDRAYRKVVEERLGGTLIFVDCDRHGEIGPAVKRAHAVIHISSYGSHAARQVAQAEARRLGKPFIYQHQSGIHSLERTLVNELLPLLYANRRPLQSLPS